MEKYRLVELIHDSGLSDRREREWIIERKRFWGWREIFHIEGTKVKRITHKTRKEAETYLLDTYTGHGRCEKYGNVYLYTEYTYSY